MKRNLTILLALALAITACHKSAHEEGEAAEAVKPTAAVRTVKLEKSTIAATITAYGTVVAQSDQLLSVSVQYESKVMRLLVSAGETVEEGQALIEVEPSPDTKLQLAEATSAADSAQIQLEQAQNRFSMKLALNQELQLAKQAARDSAATLSSLTARGAGDRIILKAEASGQVSSIEVRIGHIVPAGSPLLSVVPGRRIEALLGVEPESAGRLHEGQKVHLVSVNQEGVEGDGKIRLITRRVNPETRLVDTFASVPPDVPFIFAGYLRGEIEVEQKDALVVPRDAVLPDEDGSILFTVRDGHAVEHKVVIGLQTDTLTEVTGEDLQVGDEVITVGIHQLENGMAVEKSE